MDGAARLGTDDWNVHMQGEIAEATTVGQVQTIQASLSRLAQQVSRLAQQAEDKIVALKEESQDFRDGFEVVMLDSNQIQEQIETADTDSRSVAVKFTAGPRRIPFSLSIGVTNWNWKEKWKSVSIRIYWMDKVVLSLLLDKDGNDTLKDTVGAPTQEELDDFVTRAGFGMAPISAISAEQPNFDDANLRMFAFGGVINEAMDLFAEKYGCEDDCGVGLGIENEEIYSLLGLHY